MAARKVLTRAESQAQTRQELLDAAEPLFLEKGYHATSIAAIAEAAGAPLVRCTVTSRVKRNCAWRSSSLGT
ncbi:TetR family transcriptional regulator [Mycobacteroides abscessus]